VIGSALEFEITTGLVTVEKIVDCTDSTVGIAVVKLAVVATLLHLADRAKLHCLFEGIPAT